MLVKMYTLQRISNINSRNTTYKIGRWIDGMSGWIERWVDRRLGAMLKPFGWKNWVDSRQAPLTSIPPNMASLLEFDFRST